MSPLAKSTIATVGSGVMAEAMIAGMLRGHLVEPGQVVASHPRLERREHLAREYGIRTVASNTEAVEGADVILFGIKPQMLAKVGREIGPHLKRGQLVLSVLAGATTAALTGTLGHDQVVRSMPNTPARLGKGMTVWYATPETTDAQRAQAAALLGALGHQLEVDDEKMVAMATAVSGTGPTYVFLVMEALIDAAVHLGFPRHIAHDLVIETLEGSTLFAKQSGMHPAELRNMVTSPGGTSAAALHELEFGPAPDGPVGGGLGGISPDRGARRAAGGLRRPGQARLMPTAPTTPSPNLTVEAIVAIDAPREYRLHPRDRVVAYTAEAAGTRQLFTLSLRGGYPAQLTASEKPVSDPQWSPDGRRLAFVRDEEIWVVEADGSRLTLVVGKPGGGRGPRWSPDGHRLAFLSRRRGWTQIWLIDAPVPRRGRPASEPKPPRPTVLTETGIDVDAYQWAPDGTRIAVMARRGPEVDESSQIALVDVATKDVRVVASERSVDVGARWLPDGSLLYVSDADGWFQVVRLTADGHDRIVLTAGEREHGEPGGGDGSAPLPSPDGSRFVHIEVHDALQDLLVGELAAGATPRRGRGRPPKTPRVVSAAAAGSRINPWDGVWRSVGWLADGAWVAAIGERETTPQDLWLLPVPGVAPDGSRPRQITDSMPAVVRAALAPARVPAAERVVVKARDGLRIEGTLWRPLNATGKRGGRKVPTVVIAHGGPTAQSFRAFSPFKQLLVAEGFAVFDVDFRGSTGYGRAFRVANVNEWGHADVHDLIDAARWATAAAVVGRAPGDPRQLVRRLSRPVRAGR